MSVTRQMGRSTETLGHRDLLPKLQVSAIVPDEDAWKVATTIAEQAALARQPGARYLLYL
jgi:hypothetical protein